ncbi:uncharacterized protein Z518_02795 [Rhinocladiella mackenziei CBS 650.93]|uniref:Rhinocladiella mackenziei CBS 650.93 unplaced genomic scaffold supercont1.2, whole genome shotgun sequence n=1 Tax=Rhinocladiella mackenziei CBS 650.93 TaxID=1442369 RepID=A0A0D2IQE2_9EURO|nr:uncharacterized protein Z518_02795 [Rhinocladiella mackenziei CBS 650.93]KIX08139.1 hypothetical protein Z518_02795 [Rhinocladiella mackenziei CBS 650.93]
MLHLYPLSPHRKSDHAYLPAIARIHLAAWLTNPMMRTVFYGPASSHPEFIASNLQRHSKAFVEEYDDERNACRFAVVIDDAWRPDPEEESGKGGGDEDERPKGEVIAAIKYYLVNPNAPTSETASAPSSTAVRTWPPYSNGALASHFWSCLVHVRTRLTALLGPHVLVDNLYTDPVHHRRGAGGMLMQHACAEADAKGWPSMLEASPAGLGVYERVGFRRVIAEDVDQIWVDLKRWENGGDKGKEFSQKRLEEDGGRGDGWYAQVVMVRPATVAGGTTIAVDEAEVGREEAAVV